MLRTALALPWDHRCTQEQEQEQEQEKEEFKMNGLADKFKMQWQKANELKSSNAVASADQSRADAIKVRATLLPF